MELPAAAASSSSSYSQQHPPDAPATETTRLFAPSNDEGDTSISNQKPSAAPSRKKNATTPILIRHDSEFSVNTSYSVGTQDVPRLNVWQGAALLTADCLGTGLLALPADIHVLGLGLGLGFLLANLPINLYAGTIFHFVATAIEQRHGAENKIFQQALSAGGGSQMFLTISHPTNKTADEDDVLQDDDDAAPSAAAAAAPVDYREVNQNTVSSVLSALTATSTADAGGIGVGGRAGRLPDYDAILLSQQQQQQAGSSNMSAYSFETVGTAHTMLHHDTATYDFIGVTQALFQNRIATRWVMLIYYSNIFLVLGNYILVMSHAVQAVVGEEHICLPTAGLLASTAMFLVSQLRTMARLGRTASIVSLTALFIVVVQCLWALHEAPAATAAPTPEAAAEDGPDGRLLRQLLESTTVVAAATTEKHSMLRKLSAIGSIGFAVGSQKLFLNIRHELSNRSVAPQSLAISLSAFGSFYVLIVCIAGANPPPFLFDAIPPGWNRRIAGLLLWGHVVVSYAINSQAICSSMDRLVWHRIPWMPQDKPALRWLTLTGIMSVTAYTVANAIPFFADLVSLIGAVTSVPLTLLLPGIFWRKHLSVPLWGVTKDSLWSAALVYFSCLFMVTATLGSLYSIEQDWSRKTGPFSCH